MIKNDNKKHAESIVKKIMDTIPLKLLRQTKRFSIQLINERVDDRGSIRNIGYFEVKGMIINAHTKIKIMEIIKKMSNKRKIKDMIVV
jgi:hypothetical protein